MLEQSSTNMYTCSQLSSHNIQLLYHHIDTYNRHHHHSGSCNEHTSIILCARAARKQTTTSGAATTYYYHHHHTVQVTILRPPHAFLDENDCHHHHTVQVTMHAFSICTIALEKTPPPPHSASYNITATTTCVSRVSALVGHRKRPPPVQVTVATTTCASRVSALVGHRKRPPVQVTVAPDQHTHHSHHHMCQKVNALNGRRKRPPAQVTAGQNLHRRHWSARCSKQL